MMSPRAKATTVESTSKEPPPPVYADDTAHIQGICDNCKQDGKYAYCVTSAKKHLHSCWNYLCKDALEKRLHG